MSIRALLLLAVSIFLLFSAALAEGEQKEQTETAQKQTEEKPVTEASVGATAAQENDANTVKAEEANTAKADTNTEKTEEAKTETTSTAKPEKKEKRKPFIDWDNLEKYNEKQLRKILKSRGVECAHCTERSQLLEEARKARNLPPVEQKKPEQEKNAPKKEKKKPNIDWDNLEKYNDKQLRKILKSRGVECAHCKERSQLLEEARKARNLPPVNEKPRSFDPSDGEIFDPSRMTPDEMIAFFTKKKQKQDKEKQELMEKLRKQGINVDNIQIF